jgi:hypothetical protein
VPSAEKGCAMSRFALRVILAAVLTGTGWMVGRAQTAATPAPDFEITIVAPAGNTAVACVRGCEFGASRNRNGVVTHGRFPSFSQSCQSPATTCEIAVQGWVTK